MTQETETPKITSIPFLIRLGSILILVTGSIGLLFYLFAAGFQLTGQNYLYGIDFKGFGGSSFYVVISMQLVLNAGLILSGIFLLKLKKTGIYLFSITFIVMALLNYFLQGDKNLAIPIIGTVIIILLFLYKNKMK